VAMPAAAGVVYRWLDEQGNMVVSDRQPANGVDFETISTNSGRTVTVSAPEAKTEEPPIATEEKTAPEQNAADQTSKPKKDDALCKQAMNNMRILEDGPRVRFTDDKGEVRFMTDDERVIEKERTADAIEAYCD
jgi:transcriptional regulator of nitric oxide reductase